jgi:pimeloyl-ACP methyl ester carboxylesterase
MMHNMFDEESLRGVVSRAAGTAPPVATDRPVVVRGLKLHTQRRRGSTRPPLLLLHGIGGSLDSWRPLLAALPDRDFVMVDSPGAGRSGVPSHPISMSAVADYVADVVRELGIVQPVDVLGYSLGGLVAQELARRHPALVRRLVLVSTIMGFHGPPPKLKVQLALMSPARYTNPAAAGRDIPLLAGGRTAREPAALAAIMADRASHPPPLLGYMYQQMAVIGWSSRRWLSELRVPTLVLHGEEDPVVHVVNACRLADRIAYAELEIVAGAGHMLLFDESEKAGAILEPFLAA